MTYLQTDESICLSYLKDSVEVAKELKNERLEGYAVYNYNFARILLSKKVEESAPDVLKKVEGFRKGKVSYEDALDCVGKMGDPDLTGYFEAISGDRKSLYKKFCDFVSGSNLYYASIIVRDLMEAGECTDFIKNLTINLREPHRKKEMLFLKKTLLVVLTLVSVLALGLLYSNQVSDPGKEVAINAIGG